MQTTSEEKFKNLCSFREFNLNDSIYVRLTDLGYKLLADEYNSYIGVINNWQYRTPQYYKDQVDVDGFTAFQTWDFIEKFGKVTGIGMPQYFHLTVRFDERNLSVNVVPNNPNP